MFAKRKKRPFIEVTKLSSLIAEDVEITGDVHFSGGIRIDGRIKGNVVARAAEGQTRALLVLSDKGHIEGTVNCGDAVINGTVIGDLTSSTSWSCNRTRGSAERSATNTCRWTSAPRCTASW